MILRDKFSANKIAFMVTDMFNSAKEAQVKWWSKMKEFQLTSIYKNIASVPGISDQDEIKTVTCSQPHPWNPVATMERTQI